MATSTITHTGAATTPPSTSFRLDLQYDPAELISSPLPVCFPLDTGSAPRSWQHNCTERTSHLQHTAKAGSDPIIFAIKLGHFSQACQQVLQDVLLGGRDYSGYFTVQMDGCTLPPVPELLNAARNPYEIYSPQEQAAALRYLEMKGDPFGLTLPEIKTMLVVGELDFLSRIGFSKGEYDEAKVMLDRRFEKNGWETFKPLFSKVLDIYAEYFWKLR